MNTDTTTRPAPVVKAGDKLRGRHNGIVVTVAESFVYSDGWTVVNHVAPVGQFVLRWGWTFDWEVVG
jgi:hypothetical protein